AAEDRDHLHERPREPERVEATREVHGVNGDAGAAQRVHVRPIDADDAIVHALRAQAQHTLAQQRVGGRAQVDHVHDARAGAAHATSAGACVDSSGAMSAEPQTSAMNSQKCRKWSFSMTIECTAEAVSTAAIEAVHS